MNVFNPRSIVTNLFLSLLATVGAQSFAQTRFNATPLGSIDPGYYSIVRAINNNGDAVGHAASVAYPAWEATLYSNGVATGLGTFGGELSDAIDINDNGVIVGNARNSNGIDQAFKYQAGVMTKLLPGSSGYSFANGINNLGAIVGQVGPGYPGDAAIFGNDTYQRINSISLWATSINDKGQVVGDKAFFYDAGAVSYPIFPAGSSYQNAGAARINSGGDAVGFFLFQGDYRAFVIKNGEVVDISQGGQFVYGASLNDIGQIVGAIRSSDGNPRRAGFLDGGTLFNLNDISTGLEGWLLIDATDINNKGQIVANGWSPTLQRYQAFRLDPISDVPVPATIVLLGLGLVGICAARRKRV